jgi:signal transduction histidine kinase
MPSGGTLKIKTYQDDQEVVLMVQDQGRGIDPSLLDKLGTPFLTTKDEGTGLGLAVCFSIAERHKATIKVETNSSGSTFSVRFKNPISSTKEFAA